MALSTAYTLWSYGRGAFAIAGPTTWNSLSTHLRRVENSTAAFGRLLKTQFCFLSTSVYSALGVSAIMRYINRRFTYILTYSLNFAKAADPTKLFLLNN